MASTRSNSRELTLISLEEIAVAARNGFACMFSTSDEYEAALISERRAEGRYRKPNRQASEATPFFERLWPGMTIIRTFGRVSGFRVRSQRTPE